ncbi:MAG: HD domain-containing protein [Firmicutes bacterium]|nr:HD domain-containing protein [Bacillota bacterium]
MHEVFENMEVKFDATSDICEDVYSLLLKENFNIVANHVKRVGKKSRELARKFKYDEQIAEIASYLHDISVIIPNSEKIQICELLNIEVLEEEKAFPLLIHQKLSRKMAEDIYGVENEDVLSAINCHTTLKRDSKTLDLILFVADKIEWDQQGIPPYLETVEKGLEKSLEDGAYAYVEYIIRNKKNLKVVHPWLVEAYEDLKNKLG